MSAIVSVFRCIYDEEGKMAKKAHRWTELLRLVDEWPNLVGIFPLTRNEAKVICEDGSTAYIDWNGKEWTEHSQPRADLPPDADEWRSKLQAKSDESLELAARIWERTNYPPSTHSFVQVHRTLAGLRGLCTKIDLETARLSARRCGLFDSDEAAVVAEAILAFRTEITALFERQKVK
jgi:hypothetical protein